jgi:hypothetical protein
LTVRYRSARGFFAETDAQFGEFGTGALAFTIAPHLQIINYRSGFSRFGSI